MTRALVNWKTDQKKISLLELRDKMAEKRNEKEKCITDQSDTIKSLKILIIGVSEGEDKDWR